MEETFPSDLPLSQQDLFSTKDYHESNYELKD
jgi:hypothetical protein